MTANYGASNEKFGISVAISGDKLLDGAYGKDGNMGAVPPMNLSLQDMDHGMKECGQFQEMEFPQNMSLSGK